MKVIVDLPENVVNRIQTIITRGEYSSLSQFLQLAAENQLTLEFTDLQRGQTNFKLPVAENVSPHLRSKPYLAPKVKIPDS